MAAVITPNAATTQTTAATVVEVPAVPPADAGAQTEEEIDDDDDEPEGGDAAEAIEVPAAASSGDGVVHQIPERRMSQIKAKARGVGRKAAMKELDARAQAMGFANIDEALSAAAKAKGKPTAASPLPEEPEVPEVQVTPSRRQVDPDRTRLASVALTERRRREQAEANAEALSTRYELQLAAVRAGVQDVDYAMTLFDRHLRTIANDDKALAEFDENTYFSGLREKHPHLFSVQEVPATTGPGASPTPASAPVLTPEQGAQKVDVRKMPKAEYDAWLREHKLTNPTSGALAG